MRGEKAPQQQIIMCLLLANKPILSRAEIRANKRELLWKSKPKLPFWDLQTVNQGFEFVSIEQKEKQKVQQELRGVYLVEWPMLYLKG